MDSFIVWMYLIGVVTPLAVLTSWETFNIVRFSAELFLLNIEGKKIRIANLTIIKSLLEEYEQRNTDSEKINILKNIQKQLEN